MIVQLFKQHRWWWTVHQSLNHDEDGNIILPPSLHNQTVNLQLYKENFAEHNFLWTQWKKNKHFNWLKPFKEEKVIENQEEDQQITDQNDEQ